MKILPKLRQGIHLDMRSAAANAAANALEARTAQAHPYQSCINCDNFDERNELCKLVNQRPPARIIVFGCDKYDDNDQIPF